MGTAATAQDQKLQALSVAGPPPEEHEHGAIFTKRWVAEMVLDLAGYTADRPLHRMVAIEPACGEAAFLVPMVERLSDACKRGGHSLLNALSAIRAYDLQAEHVAASRSAITDALIARGWSHTEAVQFSEHIVHTGDFLLLPDKHPVADFVLGNPPYIRLEAVPSERNAAYRQSCPTMSGRADIYVGFFEVGLKTLRDEGVLSFICADRWMRNQYGRLLRQLVVDRFSVEAVVEMHAVDAFDMEVSAYPSVTTIRRRRQRSALVAETTAAFGAREARSLLRWHAGAKGDRECSGDSFRAAVIPGWFQGSASWPSGSPSRLTVLRELESRFPMLEDDTSETRVGIGVATGADQVFITTDASVVESQRLLPLAMAYDTLSGRLEWSQHYLVNPWRADGGGLVNLDEFPRLRAYYEKNSKQLGARNIAKRRPSTWFRTIDRVNPALTGQEKLLFPDIKASIHPVLDRGQTYPHHNLYFVVSRDWDLEVLGGLLLSRIAQLFIEAYAVRMRGNYLRFQAQYLRRIRVPRIADVGDLQADALREAFLQRDVSAATRVAEQLYGIEIPD